MSDSDSEYQDLVENVGREARVGDVESVKGPKKNAAGKTIRGPDKSWKEKMLKHSRIRRYSQQLKENLLRGNLVSMSMQMS